MRAVLPVVLAACLLAACGSGRPAPEASRAVAAPVVMPTRAAAVSGPLRFVDDAPHDWQGIVPAQYPVHGIDVSKWQGEIDWPAVRASGVDFAFIKATEGGDVLDARFAENWVAARRAGVLRGAYHFYYFCRPAAEQAAWFAAHVPREPGALPPVLDMEWNHLSRTCPRRPSAEHVRSEMRVFKETLAAHYGKRPIIYTTVDFYRDNELWRVDGYEFWLRSVAGHPGDVYPGQPWTFWQYTGTGRVPGIAGPADINAFAGNHVQWAQWVASRAR
jgi:lysozyme